MEKLRRTNVFVIRENGGGIQTVELCSKKVGGWNTINGVSPEYFLGDDVDWHESARQSRESFGAGRWYRIYVCSKKANK